MRTARWFLAYIGIFLFFVLDRILKFLASRLDGDAELISGVLVFSFEKNQVIAWNIPLSGLLLYVIMSILLIVLVVFLSKAYRQRNLQAVIGILLILAGAFSNILDRIRYDAVIDYLRFSMWPTTNIADMMIFLGAVILIIRVLSRKEKNTL